MWSVTAVSSHPIVSNGTRRVTGSDADGLLSEDKKTELKGACAAFGAAWKAAYDRPLIRAVVGG